ncbi:Glucose-induced degradation protein 8-like protein [Smittium mucronatum]|uniref:Glucose-induced degradation protein 8-like protein n=1 Tax=Smittium mucronatum TaxID=133383 RepID=A0A1R0H3R5_9FUNG|nr:Glucose-induced degradation protein 8-like protein [Smittium mucronatum]
MEYLVIEGYKDAAENFIAETGGTSPVDLDSIEDRMRIRALLQAGDVASAIAQINEIDPLLLELNPRLFFALKQQQLIELVRGGRVEEALLFSQEELAQKGLEHPELLPELETTMSLFAFDFAAGTLLNSQSQPSESRLPSLLHLLAWAQDKLSEKAEFPKITNIFTGEFTSPP